MKIRVLLAINNLHTAGMKYVLAAIANGLDKNLFDVSINVNQKTDSQLENLLSKNFIIHETPLRFPGFIKFIPNLISHTFKFYNKADIIHDFDYSSDWNSALVSRFTRSKYITEKTNLSIVSNRWKLKLFLSNHIVCLSNAQLNLLKKYKHKISLIPTGVEISRFENATRPEVNSFGIIPSDIVFICIANLVKVKGHEELIDALSIVHNEYPSLKILAVGHGEPEYINQLKQKVKSLGLENNFIFSGHQSDISSILKFAHLKILSTQNRPGEAFGAVLPEAMAAGLPVLSTRSGGPEDIVIENETGWLVNADGPLSLANGIRKAMQDRDEWERMGRAGQQRAKLYYDETSMVANYSNLYNKLFLSN